MAGKVHGQLRRIRNESSQLKDATVTGIPCQHSKVSFKFTRVDPCSKACDTTVIILTYWFIDIYNLNYTN